MYFKPVILLKDPNIVSHVHRYMPVIPELRSCGKRIKTFDAKMIQEFSGVQGSWVHSKKKAQANTSSRSQKDFICREGKGCWGHVGGRRNEWSCGSGWNTFFIA
jgi:hypothetical protein